MESDSEHLDKDVDAGVDSDIDMGVDEGIDAGADADVGADAEVGASVASGRTNQKINLRVWLKIPDAEAATVKNTLVRRLGFGKVLEDVKKERLFSIEIDSGDPEEMARRFAKELVNENKESHKVLIDTLEFEEGYVPVKVALHIEDGEAISTRERLRNRLGFKNVVDVKKATIWKLYFSLLRPEAEMNAREIAEKLLINPHKDTYEILMRL
jgi:phosphoribosylformylglycinamidine (FGAM) synthase PurS component